MRTCEIILSNRSRFVEITSLYVQNYDNGDTITFAMHINCHTLNKSEFNLLSRTRCKLEAYSFARSHHFDVFNHCVVGKRLRSFFSLQYAGLDKPGCFEILSILQYFSHLHKMIGQ